MTDTLTTAAVVQIAPDRAVLGLGPFTARAHRDPTAAALYAPDFFLDDPAPWKHPTAWREVGLAELRDLLSDADVPGIEWQGADRAAYERMFAEIMRRIETGMLTKAVPVSAGRGCFSADVPTVGAALLARAIDSMPGSSVYGLWDERTGIVGATPEHLFRIERDGVIHTVAVAGTYPRGQGAALRADQKELAEHQSVVDDIAGQLAPLGEVTTGTLDVLELPHMTHLTTDLTVLPHNPVPFERLVRTLHPTAALGMAPRARRAEELRTLDPTGTRRRFGAPFGIEWADGRAVCLVAIRNVQWDGRDVILAVGGGVVSGSRLEREWEELRLKRDSVRRMFGL